LLPPVSSCIEACSHKSFPFTFRGIEFEFALSQGLFSSAGVDGGTRFLLKIFSHRIDEVLAAGQSLPRSILDAGSGAGILGVCAARALNAARAGWDGRVRAQDRDELARIFTLYNAAVNGVSPAFLTAHTEPLLAGPPEGGWDLILSNVPAKTGRPVLLDFVSRSADLLKTGGQVMIVVVNPLAQLFRSRIAGLELPLLYEEKSREHTVFIYGKKEQPLGSDSILNSSLSKGDSFLQKRPAYLRGSADYTMEKVSYHIDAFHGAAGFDTPGMVVQTAVKLLNRLKGRLGSSVTALVHEPDQGHFPAWLASSRLASPAPAQNGRWVFSGRNILALEAARHNTLRALGEAAGKTEIRLLPAVDPDLDRAALTVAGDGGFDLIALFPEAVPHGAGLSAARLDAWWDALVTLPAPGGILMASLSASGAERFDRRKPKEFTRLGDIKRAGFRALAYEYKNSL
jgi:hypothetical protein